MRLITAVAAIALFLAGLGAYVYVVADPMAGYQQRAAIQAEHT